jgi:8-amino-7-oxononanoate synthase
VAGFAKALAREWTETRVKAVELAPPSSSGATPDAHAARIHAELCGTDATVEVSYAATPDGGRHVVELVPAALPSAAPLRDGVVVAISGGSRGLGAKLARELAARFKARLILLGRTAGGAEIAALIEDVRRSGGDALHLPCDVRDEAAVASRLDEGRRRFGPIEVVVHAAGLIADAPIAKKTDDDFARVFDTKVGGAIALLRATAADPLATFLIYGSWAGRLGNGSQTDYSAANHVVASLAQSLAERRGARVVTIDLPPWEESSMVQSIPAPLRTAMRQSGVTFLSDRAGNDLVIAELCAGASGAPSGEVMVGRDLPAAERADVSVVRIAVASHPYLDDHRIQGKPVLPLAAAMDYAAAAAARITGRPVALEGLELHGGVILSTDEVTLSIRAREDRDGTIELDLATIDDQGSRRVAYRGRARVKDGSLPELPAPATREAPPLALAEFYDRHTFHGPRLRGIVSVDEIGGSHVTGVVRSARPSELIAGSRRDRFAVDPLLVDSSFQLAAYWAFVKQGRAGLPLGFDEWRALRPIEPGAKVRCQVVLEQSSGDLWTGHIDYRGEDGTLVAQLRGMRAELRKVASTGAGTGTGTGTNVPEEAWNPAKFPEVIALRQRLDLAQAMGISNPYFNVHERVTNDTSVIGGREYINFSSYNYLGLSGDPTVNAAVAAACERYGTSVSASRVASGEKPLHRELEAALARFLGTEDCVVMVGGHATNVSTIGQVVGPEDLILHDALAHDSIMGGARLSGAKRRPFPHNDTGALDRTLTQLRGQYRRVLIAVEGTYSMDGDVPPLDRIIEVKKKHRALLFVDEAHSFGVLGATGRGIGEHFAVDRADVDMWMGTMSKTLASCGGWIAGSHALVEWLKYTAGGFVYSVGMSPQNTAAALAALRELEARPELVTQLRERSRFFLDLMRERGIDTGMSEGTAVIPCIVGNSWDCLQLAQALGRRGINVQPILYPAVEEHLARLRFFVTSRHSEEQLRFTADAVAEELDKLDTSYRKRGRSHTTPQPSPGGM